MAITYTSSGNCNVVVNTTSNTQIKDDGFNVELETTSIDFLEHLVAISDGYGAVSISILTGVVSQQLADQTGAVGTSASLARADHIHNIPTATAVSVGVTNAQGSSTSFAKADHVHQGVHSLHSNAGANRYGDLSLQQGTGITITDDGYGNFTVAASGASFTDEKVKISAADTTPGYLDSELTVSNGTNPTSPLEKSITSPGADEKLNIQLDQTKLSITASQVSDFTEATQDVIGTTFVDSTTVDFTYNDAGNTITAVVLQAGLTFGTATPVASANVSGVATSLSRSDHVHQGIHSVDANGGTDAYGDITLQQGTNITIVNSPSGTFTISASGGVDEKVKVSAADTTPGYLNSELTVSNGTNATNPLEKSITSPGADEKLNIQLDQTKLSITSSQVSDFTEATQDVIGATFVDSTTIDFTYNDAGNTITAVVLQAGLTFGTPVTLNPDVSNASGSLTTLARADHIHNIPAATAISISATTTNTEGTSTSFARADHTHAISTGVVSQQLADQTNAAGTSANLARADHIHNIPTAIVVSVGAANAQGSSTSFVKADHVHQGIHSVDANGGTDAYGDITLQQGTNVTIVNSPSGTFTINATAQVGTGLKIKAGTVTAATFTGSPRKATITFGAAFASTAYSINITGADNRNWTWESKAAGSFVINTNANTALTLNVDWSAIVIGESN